jgi:DNA gyrase inhibitor GyrI
MKVVVTKVRSNCTSRRDCRCDSCVKVRAEIAQGRKKKDEDNKLAEDFLRSYVQTRK